MPLLYSVGDKIVHPMHGAGVIENIVSQKVEGALFHYYVMKMPVTAMLVMIPTHTANEIGVRAIVDSDTAEELIGSLPDLEISTIPNWNRRYRENMLKIKSGDPMEVARVVKGLSMRDRQRGLSTGERKLLHSARQIMISEIVLAQSCSYADVENRINIALA